MDVWCPKLNDYYYDVVHLCDVTKMQTKETHIGILIKEHENR